MHTAQKIVDGADAFVTRVVSILLLLALLFGAYALIDTYLVYARAGVADELLALKPDAADPDFSELQAINPDICAWLTLDGTHIDHPIVQGKDNDEYLNIGIYRETVLGGSIFMDYRNDFAFGDYYSLLYGHHMDNGAMFGDIREFEAQSYYDAHQTGTLYTPGLAYDLEIIACLHVDAYDGMLFSVPWNSEQDKLLSYIAENALFQSGSATAVDKLLAMSTCSDATTNGRTVLIAKMHPHAAEEDDAQTQTND